MLKYFKFYIQFLKELHKETGEKYSRILKNKSARKLADIYARAEKYYEGEEKK